MTKQPTLQPKTEAEELTVRLMKGGLYPNRYAEIIRYATFSSDRNEIRKTMRQQGNRDRECYALQPIRQIDCPEWQALFPQTTFYLFCYDYFFRGKGRERQCYHLAEQAEKIYDIRSFHLLYNANNILATDENRETIVRAMSLLRLPGYLDDEIIFSPLEKLVNPTEQDERYNLNYQFTIWTKMWGYQLACKAGFKGHRYYGVDLFVEKDCVGDYIKPKFPPHGLSIRPLPSLKHV